MYLYLVLIFSMTHYKLCMDTKNTKHIKLMIQEKIKLYMSFNNNYDEMLPIFIIKNSNKELSAKYISKFSEVYKTCQLDLKKWFVRLM